MIILFEQTKELLSKTAVAILAPTTGTVVGVMSFFEEITPALTVLSLVTGVVIGILSYRLKCKKVAAEIQEIQNKKS